MKKIFSKLSGFILIFTIVFVVTGLFNPIAKVQAADELGYCVGVDGTVTQKDVPSSACDRVTFGEEWHPNSDVIHATNDTSNAVGGSFWGGLADALTFIPGIISIGILKIASLLTYLAGALLNLVTQYTVVDMKKNLDGADAVNNAWRVIRDVANMGFIFVLLYAAIEQILGIGKDNQRLIVRIVVVAILINFSLFFTKFVIDASNILAMTFYDAIAPGALTSTATGLLGKTGIADSLMQPLGLQSIWNTTGLSGTKILTVGVMGTIVTLIAAFVFFAIALMFIIRFVVLIFILILSPIAFIAFILPQAEKYRKQWSEALVGQAFFAPIYFMLTWIVIIVSRGLLKGGGSMADALGGTIGAAGQAQAPTSGELQILLNFIIMIALMISSLMIAKEWANKAGGGVNKLTSWATGAAGGATIGMAGKLGRNTVGNLGQKVADSQWLRERAPDSRLARLALSAGKKTGSSSFDFRATTAGGATVGTLGAGKAGGKGGYQKQREDTVKRRMDEADRMEDTVTGTDVEREMDRRGFGKVENERLGRTAYEVEAMRREVQLNPIHGLAAGARANTQRRKERFLHDLSQTHWYTPNLYSGVSTDAEAAKRMRDGKKSKSNKDTLIDALKKVQEEDTPPPPTPTPTP